MSDFQMSLIASAVIVSVIIVGLLIAYIGAYLRVGKWQNRALETRRLLRTATGEISDRDATIADRDATIASQSATIVRMYAEATDLRRQRDLLTAGRTVVRPLEPGDIEFWRGEQTSWS
jgi:hypothetical protein